MSTEFPKLCKWNAFTVTSITRCEDCITSKENICHSVANRGGTWVVEWQPQDYREPVPHSALSHIRANS
jgi:hypothetical protein